MTTIFLAQYIMRPALSAALFTGLVATIASAQQDPNASAEKSALLSKAVTTPTLDGLIQENEWSDATMIADLYQISPNEYAPPSEKTEFLLKYDSNYFYVAAKVYESDAQDIVARVSRQGAENQNDDGVRIFLDPYNSKRSGYEFALNLNGVRNEAIFLNITSLSEDWTGIWDGRARRTDYGWSAEIAIPFKTLTFDASNDTWGVNLYRYKASINETSGWVSQNRSTNASVSGQVRGFTNMNQGMGLDIVPSTSIVGDRYYTENDDEIEVEPSLDLFYKITPSLNGALTINTDFSATEVDDQQVDLSQFSLFFPEKRSFFLREFDVFEFGGIGDNFANATFSDPERQNARPFFSRTIGLSDSGAPVDIIAGAKVSGKIDRFDIGVLAVRQDEFVPADAGEIIDADTVFVGRVSADVLEESSIGAIFTDGDPRANLDNSLAGLDFRYRNSRLGAGKRIDANAWYQQTDTEGLSGDDAAFGAMFSMPNSQGWAGLAQYQRVEQNFNPGLGFVSRSGAELARGVLGYTFWYDDHPWLRSIYTGGDFKQWDRLDGAGIQTSQFRYNLFILETQSGDNFRIPLNRFVEGVYPDGRQPFAFAGVTLPYDEYRFDRHGLVFSSSKARPVDVHLVYFFGDYFTGKRINGDVEIGWRLNSRFRVSGTYAIWDIDFPEGDFIIRQINARAEWAFNSMLSWVNVVQYNNIAENLGINSRLHWTPRAGQDVYFVINHNYNEMEDGEFVSDVTEATIKASYTFRF